MQMVVASSWEEDTWRIHLDGCLALLQQSCSGTDGIAALKPLEQALRFVQGDTTGNFSFDSTLR